jgi:hypothetical protein
LLLSFLLFSIQDLNSVPPKKRKTAHHRLSLMLIASCLLQPCVLLVFIRGGGRSNLASPVWGLKERHSKNLNTFGQDLLNRQKDLFGSFYGCFFFQLIFLILKINLKKGICRLACGIALPLGA